MTINTTVRMVDPKQAAALLEKNLHNRPLKQRMVNYYASQMKAGAWKLNGEPIILDTNGNVADGQHRLWACIEADTPFETVVVEGVPPEVFDTIDQGAKRTAGDNIHISKIDLGGANRSLVAAVSLLVYRYRNKIMFQHGAVPPAALLNLLREEPGIATWTASVMKSAQGLRMFMTPLAATLHIASRGEPEKAEEFLTKFQTGVDLSLGSPILALRSRANLPNRGPDRMVLCAVAWNAFVSGRLMTKISAPKTTEFLPIKGA